MFPPAAIGALANGPTLRAHVLSTLRWQMRKKSHLLSAGFLASIWNKNKKIQMKYKI